MDKRKGILNIAVSVTFHILTMVTAILVKRILIQSCGNDVNGLNALYLSIVGFLSIAELGVGSAISYCMYKPIVENNIAYTSALYRLFQRVYLSIGAVILVAGLALTPFISHFSKDYQQINVDLHFTFILMLISVVITYWYGPQISLINAHKDNYISTTITSCSTILQSILQIIVLLITQSFVWYLVCRILSSLCQGIVAKVIAHRKYGYMLDRKQSLDILDKAEITKNIKAMFMHKIGTLLVTTADNIVISVFIGVNALGSYSNYNTILVSVTNMTALVFTSLTSVFGHLYVEAGKEITKRYSKLFHILSFGLGALVYLGFYAIINNLVAILFSPDLLMDRTIVFIITFNAFVQFMRKSVLAFREATGTFYYDRWKPAVEGVVNVILSVLFVQWMGIGGVIIATIITSLLICHIIEPYVLYKHAFNTPPTKYYLANYGMIGLFFVALTILTFCMQNTGNHWTTLLINGSISVGISASIWLLALVCSKTARQFIQQKLKGHS